MNTRILIFSAIIVSFYACNPSQPESKETNNQVEKGVEKVIPEDGQPFSRENLTDSNKDKVLGYFNALETGYGRFILENIDRKNHIQHNPNYSHGGMGYKELIMENKNDSPKIDVYRLTDLSDHVIAHSVLKDGVNTYICMDVFKFSEGKITEHYFGRELMAQNEKTPDNITYSGPTAFISDAENAIRNKVAANFIRYSRIEGDQNKNSKMVDEDNFTEHNQYLFKSRNPLRNYYYDLKSAGFDQEYDKLLNSVAGGNFIATISQGTRNGKPVQIFDLFRFEDIQIVEHWDVVQEY